MTNETAVPTKKRFVFFINRRRVDFPEVKLSHRMVIQRQDPMSLPPFLSAEFEVNEISPSKKVVPKYEYIPPGPSK